MKTVTLTEANYRLQYSYDLFQYESPVVEAFGKNKTTDWLDGEVQIHTFVEYGGCQSEKSDEVCDSHTGLVSKIQNSDSHREVSLALIAAVPDLQEQLNTGNYDSVLDAIDEYPDPETQQEIWEIILDKAKDLNFIHDYAFQRQSYDRHMGALQLCIVKSDGHGTAESWLHEYYLWASGNCFDISLVCDMEDAPGSARYVETLESLGGIRTDSSKLEEKLRTYAKDHFENQTGVPIDDMKIEFVSPQ